MHICDYATRSLTFGSKYASVQVQVRAKKTDGKEKG
jgi:hypothetical protein